jgi:hypothetical protein
MVTTVMTMFDERERAFENLFAHEEELRFLTLARRYELFARWAADQLGLQGDEYVGYVRSFIRSAVRPDPERLLIERVRADFIASGVETADDRIQVAMSLSAADAARQVRSEVRPWPSEARSRELSPERR